MYLRVSLRALFIELFVFLKFVGLLGFEVEFFGYVFE